MSNYTSKKTLTDEAASIVPLSLDTVDDDINEYFGTTHQMSQELYTDVNNTNPSKNMSRIEQTPFVHSFTISSEKQELEDFLLEKNLSQDLANRLTIEYQSKPVLLVATVKELSDFLGCCIVGSALHNTIHEPNTLSKELYDILMTANIRKENFTYIQRLRMTRTEDLKGLSAQKLLHSMCPLVAAKEIEMKLQKYFSTYTFSSIIEDTITDNLVTEHIEEVPRIRCKNSFKLFGVRYKKNDLAPLCCFKDDWYGKVVSITKNQATIYKPSSYDCDSFANKRDGRSTHFLLRNWKNTEFYHLCNRSSIVDSESVIIERNKNNNGRYKKRKKEYNLKDFENDSVKKMRCCIKH